MKKFFALVLALVMALSLTTMAWGAVTEVSATIDISATTTLSGEYKRADSFTGPLFNVTGADVVLTLDGVTIDGNGDNVTAAAPAISVSAGASLVMENSTITNCKVSAGCAAINATDAKDVTLIASTVSNNTSAGANAALGVYGLTGTFTFDKDSKVTGNTAADSAGVEIHNSNATIAGTISGNKTTNTDGNGAGLYTFLDTDKTITIESTAVITGNTAGGAGGGLYVNAGYSGAVGKVVMNGGQIYGNTASGTPAADTLKDGGGDDLYVARGIMEVNGGTIGEDGTESIIVSNAGKAGGKLTFNGGTVKGDIVTPADAAYADVAVVAGTFTDDVVNYLASGSVYKDGVVVKQGTVPTTGTTSTGSVTTGSVTAAKAKLYRLATAGGSMTELGAVTEIKLTSVAGKIDANVPKYVPNIYSLDGNLYIQVAKAAADYALKNNGTYIYLFDIPQATTDAAIAAYATSVVMDKLVAPADTDIDCGDCIKGGALASYYVSGENVYYADGLTWAYFKGEFVKYDATTKVVFQDHTWDATSIKVKATDVKGVNVPVSIQCKDCEKTFSIVGAKAFDNTWVKGVNYTTTPAVDAYGQYYIVLTSATAGTTTVAPSTGNTVQSAETFDAGIAMYVGMSVMAAAGSAVVIGKKKD